MVRSGTESNATLTATPADFAKIIAATTGHAIGCSCMFCCREQKRLRDEAEADHRADMEAALPPVKEEARALFEMIGRNGDSVESIRELIRVSPKGEAWLLEQARHSPRGRRGILKVLDFRRRVLEEFGELVIKQRVSADASSTAEGL